MTVTARGDGDRVRIDVTDTGIGISAEELSYLGEPFRQAKHPTVRKDGGVGLGLAIAKKFTELQQGKLAIASKLGEGTTVTVSLPSSR